MQCHICHRECPSQLASVFFQLVCLCHDPGRMITSPSPKNVAPSPDLCLQLLAWFHFRRPAGTEDASLVFAWSEGALQFTDDAGTLRPFTRYEYRARAQNSKGSVNSDWSSTQTLEAPPQALPAPQARATSAHSVLLTWTEPESPNGHISQYRVVYRERHEDPGPGSTPVPAFTVTVRFT